MEPARQRVVSTGVPGTTPREFVTFEPEAQQHDDAESMLVRNSTGSSSGSMLPISSAGFKDSNSSVYSASAKSHGPNEDDALQLLATLSDADFRECSSKCVDTFDRMYRLLHEDTVGDAAAGARQAFSEESGLSNLAQMIFSAGDSQKLADDLVASIAHLLGLSCKRCEASKDQMRETGLLAWLVKVVAESSDEQTELKRKAWCAVWYSSIGNAANEEAVCADGILRKLLQNLEDDHILCGCVNLLEAFCGHSEGHRKQISQCPETLPLLAVLAAENRPNDGPIKAQAILRLCGYHDAHFPDLRRQGWALVRPEMVSLLSTVAISHGQEGLDKISKLLRPNASGDKPSAVSRAAFRGCMGFEILQHVALGAPDSAQHPLEPSLIQEKSSEATVAAAIIQILSELCRRNNENKDQIRESGLLLWLVKSLDAPPRLRRKAVMALSQACMDRNTKNQEAILKDFDALPKIIKLLHSDSNQTLDYATYLLQLCCKHTESNRKLMIEHPMVFFLLAVLAEFGSKDVPAQARDVLKLCEYPTSEWAELRRQGWELLRPVMAALVSGLAASVDKDADLEQLCVLMTDLILKDVEDNQNAFNDSGGFHVLNNLIEEGAAQQEKIALVVARACGGNPRNQDAAHEILPWLVYLLPRSSAVVKAGALKEIAWSVEGHAKNQQLVGQKLGALPQIVELLLCDDPNVLDMATAALQFCCDSTENRDSLNLCSKAAPLLAILAQSMHEYVPDQARKVLDVCGHAEAEWESLQAQGCLLCNESARSYLAELHAAQPDQVLNILQSIATTFNVRGAKQALIAGDILSPLTKALQSVDHPVLQAEALQVVKRLLDGSTARLKSEVRKYATLLENVVRLLRHSSTAAVRAAADVIALSCSGCVDTKCRAGKELNALSNLTESLLQSLNSEDDALQMALARCIGALCSDPQTVTDCKLSATDTETKKSVELEKAVGASLGSGGTSFWTSVQTNGTDDIARDLTLHEMPGGKLEGSFACRASTTAGKIQGDVQNRNLYLVLTSNSGSRDEYSALLSACDLRMTALREIASRLHAAEYLAILLEANAGSKNAAIYESSLHALGYSSASDIRSQYLIGLVTVGRPQWQQIGSHEKVQKDAKTANVADVCLWLCENGFERYAGLFEKSQVNGDFLLKITDEDLMSQFEITGLAERKALRQAIDKLGALLGQYRINRGRIVHDSKTCRLVFAIDLINGIDVALKFMVYRDQYEREIKMRMDGNGAQLDSEYVIALRDYHELAVDASKHDRRLCGKYLLVMDRGDRDLVDSLAHDGIAGNDRGRVVDIVRDVVKVARYLNEKLSRVHGDFKPRNFVETVLPDGNAKWKAIDLDAAVLHGTALSDKMSTGFISTNRARDLLKKKRSANACLADDMFSLGMTIFQLCSVDGSTMFFCNQADDMVDKNDITDLATRWNWIKHKMLQRIPWPAARDLCIWMLQDLPSNRPPSFSALLQHPFLAEGQATLPLRFPSYWGLSLPDGLHHHYFLSHNQREAGDLAHTLNEFLTKLGLEIWYDNDAENLTADGMKEGVRESAYFLLIVTANVFQRPFCRLEIDEAFKEKKTFVVIQEQDGRFADWSWNTWSVSDEYTNVPWIDDKWVTGPYPDESENVRLWSDIKERVEKELVNMLPYRRRQYELSGMVKEVFRRCHIWEDLSEPHPTVVPTAGSLASTLSKQHRILVVFGRRYGSSIASSLSYALEGAGFHVRLSTDGDTAAEEVAAAEAVLMLLTEGTLSEPCALARIMSALTTKATLLLIQDAKSDLSPNGFDFGGSEAGSAGVAVREMLQNNEAMTYRSIEAKISYEAETMLGEIGRRVRHALEKKAQTLPQTQLQPQPEPQLQPE